MIDDKYNVARGVDIAIALQNALNTVLSHYARENYKWALNGIKLRT